MNRKNGIEVDDPFFARWSYERLLLLQPHVGVEGLWKMGKHFFAVCPELDHGLKTEDGQSLDDWFRNSGRAVGSPIRLVSAPPKNAVRVQERTAVELAELLGAPLTVRDMFVELALTLPKEFPEFDFTTSPPNALVSVSRALTKKEEDELRAAFSKLGSALNLKIEVDSPRLSTPLQFYYKHGAGDIDLMPSRLFPRLLSQQLTRLWEDDEDFWIDHRVSVLASDLRDPKALLPSSFMRKGSCCVVNAAVFPTKNLRTYLTLYRRVIIVMPLDLRYREILSSLRVSEDELVELAKRGRVQFLVTQSPHRYPLRLLEGLAEAAPDTLLFSRRLAAATIAEARRRIPLLYPPLGIAERSYLLRSVSSVKNSPALGNLARGVIPELARIWASAEEAVHRRGAMATPALGVGPLLASLFQHATGRDLFIELFSASGPVEWGAVLGATVFPVETGGYSEQAASELCASVYSGVRDEPVPTSLGNVETIVQGILSLDNDAPILEMEQAFSHSDPDCVGDLAQRIATNSVNAEFLEAAIRQFNDRVKAYDNRTECLRRWDICGLAGAVAAAGAAFTGHPAAGIVALGAWLGKYLLINADPSRDPGGRVLDWLRGINAWTTGDIVLVSRLRERLKQ